MVPLYALLQRRAMYHHTPSRETHRCRWRCFQRWLAGAPSPIWHQHICRTSIDVFKDNDRYVIFKCTLCICVLPFVLHSPATPPLLNEFPQLFPKWHWPHNMIPLYWFSHWQLSMPAICKIAPSTPPTLKVTIAFAISSPFNL